MVILLKILLGVFASISLFASWFIFREFKLFNKNVETSNTSLFERIMVNLFIIVGFLLLIFVFVTCVFCIFSNITIIPVKIF